MFAAGLSECAAMPLDDARSRVFAHDDYLTLKEAAREAKTSIPAIYRWAKKGLARAGGKRLPLHWEKSSTLVRRSELIAFLDAVREANPYARNMPRSTAARSAQIAAATARMNRAISKRDRR
jgi:hypothetical protein